MLNPPAATDSTGTMDAAELGSDEFLGTDGSSVGEMAATEEGSDVAAIELDSGEPETVFTDDYNRADEDLEDRTDFWTRIDGVRPGAARRSAATRSPSSISRRRPSMSRRTVGTEDHYVQFDTATNTLDASAFHVCRAIDAKNFIGIRCLRIGGTPPFARSTPESGTLPELSSEGTASTSATPSAWSAKATHGPPTTTTRSSHRQHPVVPDVASMQP